MIRTGTSEKETLVKHAPNVTTNSNWAGVFIEPPPNNQTWTDVSAQITVPPVIAPLSSGPGLYAAAAWVGIDGASCNQAILQGGVDFMINKADNGTQTLSYDAWYEWYPDDSYPFSGINISTGNIIQMSVHAYNLTSGTVTLENLSTGQTVTQDLTSDVPLCGSDAEWILEDFISGESNDSYLVDFAPVTFENAIARTAHASEPPSLEANDTIVAIKHGDTIYTNATISSSNQVTVEYI